MIPFKNPHRAISIAAALLTFGTTLLAQGLNAPQDTSNAIASYELLGVRLGMTEADAIGAIKKRFPAGSQDANGRPINLRMSDYELTSPKTGAKVRAGIRFDLFPQTTNNFDFVKVLTYSGRVWAVWRDDSSGRYDYDKMLADVLAKFPGASPQKTSFMVVNNNTISGQPGPPAVEGVELYKGRCLGLPFSRSSSGDSMKLEPDCRQVFNLGYQPQIKNNVKLLASGRVQLVDLDAGRNFMTWMSTGAGTIHGEKPRTTDAKL
ncbi:hypothetical protein [Polaromonas jejuensis]|uniref:Uncharacterized protein n=1 Tax=Polaromonas jejuensis TaxID=457502 RepID=A0ABW0QCT9_9BURK|nr:hypothetical protein [Polaromonas jejuensis]